MITQIFEAFISKDQNNNKEGDIINCLVWIFLSLDLCEKAQILANLSTSSWSVFLFTKLNGTEKKHCLDCLNVMHHGDLRKHLQLSLPVYDYNCMESSFKSEQPFASFLVTTLIFVYFVDSSF